MATQRNGNEFMLENDSVTALTATRGTEANYLPVVCLTSSSGNLTRAEQTTTNQCDQGNTSSKPGTLSGTISIEGQLSTLDSGELTTKKNATTLKKQIKAGTISWWRISDAAQGPDGFYEARGWLSNVSETNPTNDVVTFTATLNLTGEIFVEPVA